MELRSIFQLDMFVVLFAPMFLVWSFMLPLAFRKVIASSDNDATCVLLQVSLSVFAFLFSELVQYNQTQVDNIAELERR